MLIVKQQILRKLAIIFSKLSLYPELQYVLDSSTLLSKHAGMRFCLGLPP